MIKPGRADLAVEILLPDELPDEDERVALLQLYAPGEAFTWKLSRRQWRQL